MSENPRPPATGYPLPPSTANGYPYPAAYTATTSQPYSYSYPPRRTSFIRYFLIFLISFFIITGTVAFIFWLILHPRIPVFQVSSLSVSNFTLTNSSLTATWLLTLHVINPNHKIRIYYTDIDSSVSYKDEELSVARIPPFDQGTRNSTDVSVGFDVRDTFVDGWAASGMNADRRARGSVGFNVKVRAFAKFRAFGWWRARMRIVRVLCQDLMVGLKGNSSGGVGLSGVLTGGGRDCNVGI